MERIECEIVINRPPEAIFAYFADAKNWSEWNSLILEARAEETPLRKGSRVKTVAKFLGRRIEGTSEITEYEPPRKASTRAKSLGLAFQDTWVFEPVAAGTHVRYVAEAETHGLFKLADPIVARLLKKEWDSNLEALKEILEAPVPAVTR